MTPKTATLLADPPPKTHMVPRDSSFEYSLDAPRPIGQDVRERILHLHNHNLSQTN